MSLSNFIPQIWAARLLEALDKALVYAQDGLVNRDYEGEIQQAGDTVRINAIGDVTISSYAKDADINAPEALNDAQTTLVIDQAKYFNFAVDDVDRAQQRPRVMDEAMRRAAYSLRDVKDQFVAGLYTGVAAANMIGDDTAPKSVTTAALAYEYLVDLGVLLDEANVPSEGRWVVVPSWYHGLMQKDQRFVGNGTDANVAMLRNGQIGEAAGFAIMKSNNVPQTAGTKYKVIAGHPMAISFANQIGKVEGYRPERRFADAVKGLALYGGKLVRPTGIAVLTANKI